VVTHDLGLAWNVADRLAVMYLGRIVEQGPTEQVLAASRHPHTRALLSVVPEASHRRPQVLAGEPPDPGAGRLLPHRGRADPPRLRRASRCLLPD
jgi:ABC-type dipeptide/oligopeptide/nickel transport system ATPase component